MSTSPATAPIRRTHRETLAHLASLRTQQTRRPELTRCTRTVEGGHACGQPVLLAHPLATPWCDDHIARHNRAAAQAARVDDGVVSSVHTRRCLTEAVDGECVCR